MKYNPQIEFEHNGQMYSLYNYIIHNRLLIQHNLGEIPHTVEQCGGMIIIKANADKIYSVRIS